MPESPPNPDQSVSVATERRIRWDALAAIIAALIGLLALLVSGYTAYIERQQVRAQVWPYLIGANGGHDNELMWMNKGVGPAIVRGVEVTVDGKPQTDWNSVLQSVGLRAARYHQSFLNGNVVSPGETVHWLQFTDEDDYENFMRAERHPGFGIEICYCSTFGDCWQTGFGGVRRQPVDQCPAVPKSQQFTD